MQRATGPATRRSRQLSARELALVRAAAEGAFPPGGAIPISGTEAGIPAHVDRYLAALPARNRVLIRLLFVLIEHATLIFKAPGWDGFRRFSSLSLEQRMAVLEAWAYSPIQTRRLVFQGLRAVLTMGYFASPPVLRAIGPRAARDRNAGGRCRPALSADRPAEERDPIRCRRSRSQRVARAARSARPAGARLRGRLRMSDRRSEPGEVRVFAEYQRDFTEEADVVVVGSGPCGAVAAYELAAAGKRVVLLEEGPPFTPADFELEGSLSMARTMREGGLRFTMGTVMPTMQAIALGGGSLVNSAMCNRTPQFRFDEWAQEAELSRTTRSDLEPHYDAIADGDRDRADAGRGAGSAQPALPRRLQESRLLGGVVPAQRRPVPRQRRVLHRLPRARETVDGHLVRARRDRTRCARSHLGARRGDPLERSSRDGRRGARRRALQRRARARASR